MLSAQPDGNSPPSVVYNPDEFWLRTLLRWYIGLIVRPVSTLREIVAARPVALGLLTLLIVAVLNGVISIGLQLNQDVSSGIGTSGLASIVVWAILTAILLTIYLGFSSLIAHVVSTLLGGNGAYTGMLTGLMMLSILSLISSIPALLDALATSIGEAAVGDRSPFGLIAALGRIAVAIWMVILAVIIIRENYRLSTGVAVFSWVIWGFVAIGIPISLMVFLLVLALGSIAG